MEIQFEVRARPTAPSEARRALEGSGEELPEERIETLKLLVTELVTNSLRHCPPRRGAWRIGVSIERRDDLLHVRVSDPGRGFRRDVEKPSPLDVSGRGLYLVDRLARRWGIDDSAGTCVWFDLALGSRDRITR